LETAEYNIKITIPAWLDKLIVRPVLLYRLIRYGCTFRRIPLTQGKYAIVDPEDYYKLNKYKWHASKICNGYYAVHSKRIKGGKGKIEHIFMHRMILTVGEDKFVDHASWNGLDNRKANLRAATRSENGMNRDKYKRGTYRSRYKGLAWHPGQQKWMAYIKANGRRIHLGCFKDEVAAAMAYDTAAKKYHGKFAVFNFPNKKDRGDWSWRVTCQSK
jgi:hypothetical protein